MKHYEIVYLMSCKRNNQTVHLYDEVKSLIKSHGGSVCRHESWKKHFLSYRVKGEDFAWFYCINVRCGDEPLKKVLSLLSLNDSVLRYLVVGQKSKPVGRSCFIQNQDEKRRHGKHKKIKH